jgi:hypothetical protein
LSVLGQVVAGKYFAKHTNITTIYNEIKTVIKMPSCKALMKIDLVVSLKERG